MCDPKTQYTLLLTRAKKISPFFPLFLKKLRALSSLSLQPFDAQFREMAEKTTKNSTRTKRNAQFNVRPFYGVVQAIISRLITNFLLSTKKNNFHTTTFIAIRKYTTESACTAQTSIGFSFFFLLSVFLLRLFVFVVIRFVSRFCPHKRRSISTLSFPF